jgi:hypothetical protein
VCDQGLPNAIGFAWANHNNSKHFKYRLGIYFGGNRKAPHDIEIELKKSG